MKFRIGLIAIALLVTAPAFADDGTWNAGMSNNLPKGNGDNATATGMGATVRGGR